MGTKTPRPLYKGHRFLPEIISYCVWLYYRFSLSYRDIEEIMVQRGIMLTYETVRKWCLKFGQKYAKELRYRRSHPGDTWHLDEVFVTIKGQVHYVWRACGTARHDSRRPGPEPPRQEGRSEVLAQRQPAYQLGNT